MRYTKHKLEPVSIPPLMTKSKELYITTEPIINIYADDMSRFLVCSQSGNNFIILSYHVDTNVILVNPFHSTSTASPPQIGL